MDYVRAEAFIKRSIVERANKTEIRPKEQSEKAESYRENLWNKIQLKWAIKTETDTRTEQKRRGQARLVNI